MTDINDRDEEIKKLHGTNKELENKIIEIRRDRNLHLWYAIVGWLGMLAFLVTTTYFPPARYCQSNAFGKTVNAEHNNKNGNSKF